MSKLSMLSYLTSNGWKMISLNYVINEKLNSKPMDVIAAYVTQRHRDRMAAMQEEAVPA